MAGTVTVSEARHDVVKMITYDWLSSAGGAADGASTYDYNGKILGVQFIPNVGLTQPSDQYDVTLLDENGGDVLNGTGANRSNAANEWLLSGLGYIAYSPLTLHVTAAGSTTTGSVIVYVGLNTSDSSIAGMVTSQYAGAQRLATKTSASPLTTGTLFTYTGTIRIDAIIGRVGGTVIQDQATTVRLGIVPDSLSEYFICAAKDARAFVTGSLLSITGTAADAMIGATGVASIAPLQVSNIVASCTTSGVIKVTYGAASTGIIVWEMLWTPLSAGATVV